MIVGKFIQQDYTGKNIVFSCTGQFWDFGFSYMLFSENIQNTH